MNTTKRGEVILRLNQLVAETLFGEISSILEIQYSDPGFLAHRYEPFFLKFKDLFFNELPKENKNLEILNDIKDTVELRIERKKIYKTGKQFNAQLSIWRKFILDMGLIITEYEGILESNKRDKDNKGEISLTRNELVLLILYLIEKKIISPKTEKQVIAAAFSQLTGYQERAISDRISSSIIKDKSLLALSPKNYTQVIDILSDILLDLKKQI
jgi:hypothetical protein